MPEPPTRQNCANRPHEKYGWFSDVRSAKDFWWFLKTHKLRFRDALGGGGLLNRNGVVERSEGFVCDCNEAVLDLELYCPCTLCPVRLLAGRMQCDVTVEWVWIAIVVAAGSFWFRTRLRRVRTKRPGCRVRCRLGGLLIDWLEGRRDKKEKGGKDGGGSQCWMGALLASVIILEP